MKKLFLYTLIMVLPHFAFAQKPANIEIAVSAAHMTETDNLYFAEVNRYFYVGDAFIFKAEASYFFNAFSKRFGLGFYTNLGSPWYDGFEETSMSEFGAVLKWRLYAGKIIFVPSLYVGYRSYEGNAGEGLGLNFSVITQYPLKNITPFVDIGFLSQPAGGNDATDITYAPVFIIGGGIAINL